MEAAPRRARSSSMDHQGYIRRFGGTGFRKKPTSPRKPLNIVSAASRSGLGNNKPGLLPQR